MLIAPSNAVHTFFMRFRIDVAFLAKDARVRRCAMPCRPVVSLRLSVPMRSLKCSKARSCVTTSVLATPLSRRRPSNPTASDSLTDLSLRPEQRTGHSSCCMTEFLLCQRTRSFSPPRSPAANSERSPRTLNKNAWQSRYCRGRHRTCDIGSRALTVLALRRRSSPMQSMRFRSAMSSRRSYRRYGVRNAEGCLKVVRDVAVGASSRSVHRRQRRPGRISGELLMLERVINGTLITIEVAVIDSHPVIVYGCVQHRLRLRSSEGAGESRLGQGAR